MKLSTLLILILILTGCVRLPETADQDSSIQSISANGVLIHYRTFGEPDKPTLIVLHGGPGADHQYLLPLAELANDYFVVFYDQVGTGLSQRVPIEDITIASFIRDLDAVVQHFSPEEPVVIVGHSWGAMLGSAYSSENPERVSHLVLAEPGFVEYPQLQTMMDKNGGPTFKQILGLTGAWLNQFRARGDDYARMDLFLQKVLPVFQSPKEMCNGQMPEMNLGRFGGANFKATIQRSLSDEEFARSLHFAKEMKTFPGKILLITGSCNQLTDQDYVKQIASYYHHPETAEINKAGHFMFNDQPDESIGRLKQFLSSN